MSKDQRQKVLLGVLLVLMLVAVLRQFGPRYPDYQSASSAWR